VFGDCAQMTDGQRAIANQVMQAKPDFLFITGDIVLLSGKDSRVSREIFPLLQHRGNAADPVHLVAGCARQSRYGGC